MRMAGSFVEAKMGIGLAFTPFAPLGAALMVHGADNFQAGFQQAIYGRPVDPLTVKLLQSTGMSHDAAHFTNDLLGIGGTMGGVSLRLKVLKSFSGLRLPTQSMDFAKTEFQLNRFHEAARNLSEVGQNNIRILRNWAKSKGWEKLPNPVGGPETWGKTNAKTGKFQWLLKIKPKSSLREGLEAGSNIPRASARLRDGVYINPFTGQTGNNSIGSHIPLEIPYSNK